MQIKNNEDVIAEIGKDDDRIINYTVQRDGETLSFENVEMQTVTVFDFVILGEDKNFLNVTSGAFSYAVSMSRMVYISLFDLVRGKYGITDLAGPVGTVSVIADVAQSSVQSADWSGLFTIMALITINIGLFNLLPFPALDGGRLLLMFIELIFRKPIPQKYEGWINAAGLAILLAFMAVISIIDIWKWGSGVGFF